MRFDLRQRAWPNPRNSLERSGSLALLQSFWPGASLNFLTGEPAVRFSTHDPAPMTLRLFNTLTGQIDTLAPAPGQPLRMYACGPTVYDYGHIGNFRTFLQIDVLRRFLELSGVTLRHVMNITDV